MKTLFRSVFSIFVFSTVALLSFTACDDDEKYNFVFELQGSIVTEPGTTVTMPIVASNISSVSVSSYPAGWTVDKIDVATWTVTITAPKKYTAEDEKVEENGTLKLIGYTSAGTSVTATCYLSLLNKSIDLTDVPSNCYAIWQKDTRYTIDVTHRGEQMGEQFTAEKVDVMWQSSKDLIKYHSYDAARGEFTFFIGNEEVTDDDDNVIETRVPDGSAIIAAYDAADEVIWSWHVWVTGSDIESTAITTAAGTFMDRNLGAYANSDGATNTTKIHESYGYYYQWGRKDPFNRPYHYNMANNSNKSGYDSNGNTVRFKAATADNSDTGSEEFARKNPTTLILGAEDNGWDWLFDSHNSSLWSASQKSVNDPCPRGWRVPTSNQFAMLDIDAADDALPSAEVKDKWGWYLSDASGVKMFMLGAGRRSYETGVFTNVNNYESTPPVPWIGFYWTADTGEKDANAAKSMFFDLNTTRAVNNRYEPAREMYRANAMQIRCVRIQ